MQRITDLWKSGTSGKAMIIGGAAIALCLCCGALTLILPSTPPTAPATADLAAIQTQAMESAVAQSTGDVPTSPPAPTDTAVPTAAPTQALGQTRDQPHPVNTLVDIGDGMQLSVLSVTRPANDIVVQGNMFNSTPEPNLEYLIVKMHVQCTKSTNDKCNFSTFEFKTVGADGNIRDQAFVAGVPGEFELSSEFFGGASLEGNLVFLATQGDPSVVLFYDPLFLGEPVYIALQ